MQQNANPIIRTARTLRWVTIILLLLIVGFHVAALVMPPHFQLRLGSGLVPPGRVAQIISIIGAVLFVLALVQLLPMLRRIESGDFFSTRVTRPFRRFAGLMLISVLITTLVPALLALMEPNVDPSTGNFIPVPINMRGIWFILMSTIFFLLARLLDQARLIEEENLQII